VSLGSKRSASPSLREVPHLWRRRPATLGFFTFNRSISCGTRWHWICVPSGREVAMRSPVSLCMLALLFVAGCETMTPEARLRSEIFWDAAKACESRYRTLHIDRIDSEGNVSLHADAESRHELPAYNACYQDGVRTQVEARRKAGLTVPEMPQEPTADLD
jgi:hypothetical protein